MILASKYRLLERGLFCCVREGFEQITKALKFEMSQSNRPGEAKRHNCWPVHMPSGRTESVNSKHDFVLSVWRDMGST